MTEKDRALRKVIAAVGQRDALHAKAREIQRRGSDQLREALMAAVGAGWGVRELARELDVSHTMVQKLMARGEQ